MSLQTSLNDSNPSEPVIDTSESDSSGLNEQPVINERESQASKGSTEPSADKSGEAKLEGFKTRDRSRSQESLSAPNKSKQMSKPDSKVSADPRKHKLLRDRDLSIKLAVGAALATSSYYTRVNVGLSATSSRGLGDVTDIDVLGLKYDLTFNSEAIAVSCKSGNSKSLSPAREIFYLRGVLDYVRASTGVAAFLNKPISPHLRDLGRRLNVLIFSGDEVELWCRSLTNGLPDPGYFEESAFERYLTTWENNSVTHDLRAYLRTDYWFHLDFRNLQNVIGHLRKLSSKVGTSCEWLDVVVLDSAAHLCLTLFDLCHQIRMMGLTSIIETTSAYLFGGTVSFKARRDLYLRVQQLLASTGVLGSGGPSLPPLEPLYTQALAELAIRFIERPHAAIIVPQVIQDSIWRRLGSQGMPPNDNKNSLAAEKLAQDVLNFLGIATGANWKIKV